MPNGETTLMQQILALLPVGVLAILGGTFDYLYALKEKKRDWSFLGFIFHLLFALFTGYLVALAAVGLGYDVAVAGAASGAAGFLNIRLLDFVMLVVKQRIPK